MLHNLGDIHYGLTGEDLRDFRTFRDDVDKRKWHARKEELEKSILVEDKFWDLSILVETTKDDYFSDDWCTNNVFSPDFSQRPHRNPFLSLSIFN